MTWWRALPTLANTFYYLMAKQYNNMQNYKITIKDHTITGEGAIRSGTYYAKDEKQAGYKARGFWAIELDADIEDIEIITSELITD